MGVGLQPQTRHQAAWRTVSEPAAQTQGCQVIARWLLIVRYCWKYGTRIVINGIETYVK